MFKKLILLSVLVLLFVIPLQAQDSSKVFVFFSAFGAFPTDDGAGTYDPWLGAQFKGTYKTGERFSTGITYKSWQLKAQNSESDLSGEYIAGNLTYWVHPYNSKFNLGFMGQLGQSQIANGNEKNDNFAMVYGMVVKKYLYKEVYLVGDVEIGRFGDLENDALMISLGVGAPISF
jgi:hypothetical protein